MFCDAEIPDSLAGRSKGLLGRDDYSRAMVLHHASAVHTLGMRFAIDVAFLDRQMTIIDLCTMAPWRIGRPRRHARIVIEAAAGSFARWGLQRGDQVDLRQAQGI